MSITNTEKVNIMLASVRGETIQYRGGDSIVWKIALEPVWNWADIEYRIKPAIKNIIIEDMSTDEQELIQFAMDVKGEKTASKAIFKLIKSYKNHISKGTI